jgi:hypothetical protein
MPHTDISLDPSLAAIERAALHKVRRANDVYRHGDGAAGFRHTRV